MSRNIREFEETKIVLDVLVSRHRKSKNHEIAALMGFRLVAFRSRRRCCTQVLLMLSRSHWWACRNIFKQRMDLKHHEKQLKRNCVQRIVSELLVLPSLIFLRLLRHFRHKGSFCTITKLFLS